LLILSFLPLFVMRLIVYPVTFNALQDEIIGNLELAANKQAELISKWMEECVSGARNIAKNPFIVQALQSGNTPENDVNEYLKSLCSDFGYREVFSANRNGEVLFSSNQIFIGKNILNKDYHKKAISGVFFVSGIQPLQELTDNLFEPREEDVPSMVIAAPVKNSTELIVGVLALRVAISEIDKMMRNIHLGETGETYLVNKNGYMLTTSKYSGELLQENRIEKRTALELKVVDPFRNTLTKGVNECINGGDGYDANGYFDYRGVNVLGFWHWMPDYDWGVIAEIDAREGYGKLHKLRDSVMFIFAFLALGIVIVVFLLGKKISSPLHSITDVAMKIADGNYSMRIDYQTGDDIGKLATAINKMAELLEHR